MRVLIADDSSIMRHRLMQRIDELQCVDGLFEAHDFDQTIKGLSDIRPHVLVLDIRMPGGSGIDVLKAMKIDTRPQVVIVFTNYAYPQYYEKCITLGADYFFDKSADIEKLVAVIRACDFSHENAGCSENMNQ